MFAGIEAPVSYLSIEQQKCNNNRLEQCKYRIYLSNNKTATTTGLSNAAMGGEVKVQ